MAAIAVCEECPRVGECDGDDCNVMPSAHDRRERMIRDDETQPQADDAFGEPWWFED